MGVPKKKPTRRRRDQRRAHLKASVPNLIECPHCHELIPSHTVCPSCGWYGGKEVLKVAEEKE